MADKGSTPYTRIDDPAAEEGGYPFTGPAGPPKSKLETGLADTFAQLEEYNRYLNILIHGTQPRRVPQVQPPTRPNPSVFTGGSATQQQAAGSTHFRAFGRIDARAPMAKVKSGLSTGTLTGPDARTPDAEWNKLFDPSKKGNPAQPGLAIHVNSQVGQGQHIPWRVVSPHVDADGNVVSDMDSAAIGYEPVWGVPSMTEEERGPSNGRENMPWGKEVETRPPVRHVRR